MKKRSDFIPQSEFLMSEIGIPIERNFPAGLSTHVYNCKQQQQKLLLLEDVCYRVGAVGGGDVNRNISLIFLKFSGWKMRGYHTDH